MDLHGSAIDRAVEQCKECGGRVMAHVVAQACDHFVEHEIGRYDQGPEVDQSPEVRLAGLMVLIGRVHHGEPPACIDEDGHGSSPGRKSCTTDMSVGPSTTNPII